MYICEFSGLPGAGKSTLCLDVVKQLRAMGKTVVTLSEIKKYKNGKVIELVKALFCCKYFFFNMYAIFYAFTQAGLKESLSHAAGLILLNYKLQKVKTKKCYDYCIMEEGVIQYITSIPHATNISKNFFLDKLLEQVLCIYGKINDIACEISIDEVINRIRKRNNITTSRFDSQETPTLTNLLVVKGNNLRYVRSAIGQSMVLDMEMNYETLVCRVVEGITKHER